MRLELVPTIVGVLVGLVGAALLADALLPDSAERTDERRRRARPERDRTGEALLGAGVLCVAAALIGGDSWPYATIAMLGAFALIVTGLALNWKYVRGLMFGPSQGRLLKRRASDLAPQARTSAAQSPVADARPAQTPSSHSPPPEQDRLRVP